MSMIRDSPGVETELSLQGRVQSIVAREIRCLEGEIKNHEFRRPSRAMRLQVERERESGDAHQSKVKEKSAIPWFG